MSESKSEFKSVRLPGVVLADMYKNHLVSIEGEYVKPTAATSQPLVENLPTPALPKPEKTKNIVLPPAQALQEIATVAEIPNTLTSPPHAVLGAFKKQVLVLLNDPNAVHIGEGNLAFLSKIIASVSVSLEHIALLNMYGKMVDYASLKAQFPAKVAIYFGIEPSSIGVPMRFPHFQVQPWDGCTFLFVPSLEVLNGNNTEQTEMKKQLWTALKKIFA
jgi:hypothetical protein